MWFLPTRGRAHRLKKVLDACVDMEMSTECLIWVDGHDGADGYADLELPPNFEMIIASEHRELCGALNQCFKMYPDEPWYGVMQDDAIPMTKHFDQRLIDVTGPYAMVYCADNWLNGRKPNGDIRVTGQLCMGGALVRAMGYFAPPGLVHLYLDDCYEALGQAIGTMLYVPDVVVEHHHHANGKASMDDTYRRSFKGRPFAEDDMRRSAEWISEEMPEIVRRIHQGIKESDHESIRSD